MRGRSAALGLVAIVWLTAGCSAMTASLASRIYAQPQPPRGLLRSSLEEVWPEPGGRVSLSADEGWFRFLEGLEVERIGAGDVCARLRLRPLLREGEHWAEFPYAELNINGRPAGEPSTHFTVAYAVFLTGPGGDILGSGPETDTVCWDLDLGEGLHVADLTLALPGDALSYSRAFQIEP